MFVGPRSLRCLCGALALAAPGVAAAAAPVTGSAGAQLGVLSPVSVIKKTDLNFGTVVTAATAGTVVLNPVNGTVTTTGGLTAAGTGAHAAVFTSTGSKNSVVHIRLPTGATTLTRVGGTETVTASTWTLDGSANQRIPANQTFDFAVGATLSVSAAQVAGTYVGTFLITVQYP
ncbi:MAG TPA: DUF4402 domain-containing protein [Sphingomicrobium sp.]|nr:DUF4402 domain-containing protein [Sphingomicrobium sp.]